jgi:hypothetical protein
MKPKLLVVSVVLFLLSWSALGQNATSAKSEDRITREVRHELLMLPYFREFDKTH